MILYCLSILPITLYSFYFDYFVSFPYHICLLLFLICSLFCKLNPDSCVVELLFDSHIFLMFCLTTIVFENILTFEVFHCYELLTMSVFFCLISSSNTRFWIDKKFWALVSPMKQYLSKCTIISFYLFLCSGKIPA